MIPTLDTDRLVLRPHALADFDECHAMWADPVVMHYFGGTPLSREDVWMRLLRYAGHWSLLGYGFWAARERATGRFVGDVGLQGLQRDITPPLGPVPEAGWVLARWAHGQGFATEAVRAVLAWRETHVAGDRTVCIINPLNAASLHVAGKTGFIETRRVTYKGDEIVVLER